MSANILQVPKLGDPQPYVCSQCDLAFANATPADRNRITLHLILHVPDSTARWSLIDSWRAAEQQSNTADKSAFP
jgi:hypothetical protein